jgi:DNA-binding response OmpR family regulator
MKRILIVEDELNMRIGLKDNLEFEGYSVELAENGEIGLSKIQNNKFDLIILDVMLPYISGLDICKKIRKEGNLTPIILLTAKGEEIDKVLGLEIGADDYITKPFSLRELLARIKAVLRRSEQQPEEIEHLDSVQIGKVNVDFKSYSAFSNGNQIMLSHKEFEILNYLHKNINKTVSRDSLLKEIWGFDSHPTTRTVDNFILKLRQKIEEDSNNPKIILTVHGIGYKMIGK